MLLADHLFFSNGDQIPLIGLGTWQSRGESVSTAVFHALNSGYRHIDTALVYANESEIGEAVERFIDDNSGHVGRDDIFITSKLWNTFHSPEQVSVALDQSLKDLKMKYVDLYLMHWPCGYKEGTGTFFPLGEDGKVAFSDVDYVDTFREMGKMKDQGKVKHLGLSNFNIEQMERITQLVPQYKIEVLQVEAHPFFAQKELKQYCDSNGIIMEAYAPLGAPMRSNRKDGDPILMENEKVVKIAEKHNATPAQVLIRWCIQSGMVCLPKSVTPSRIDSNLTSLTALELTADEMAELDSIECGTRFYNFRDGIGHKYDPFVGSRA